MKKIHKINCVGFCEKLIQILVLLSPLFILKFLFLRVKVQGVSMEPTLCNNQFIIVYKLFLVFGSPKRGNVVLFSSPFNSNYNQIKYVKRIIGLPHEQIELKEGFVYINGNLLYENYAQPDLSNSFGPIIVNSECFFVMGDNRSRSRDSREFGCIPINNIIGVANNCLHPFSDSGLIQKIATNCAKANK